MSLTVQTSQESQNKIMETAIALKLLLTVAILMLYPQVESQWLPHPRVPHPRIPHQRAPHNPLPKPGDTTLPPLCASQFALVNRACGMLPYTQLPPPSPPSATPPEPSPHPLPPVPTPEPPSPDDHSHHHGHRHGHRHGHGHRHWPGHGHGHRIDGEGEGTPLEQECCRWLQTVDNECVCGLLVRLPPFLTRPIHNYTVVVGDACDVSFTCSSRIVPV